MIVTPDRREEPGWLRNDTDSRTAPFCYATGYPVAHDQDQHGRLALHDRPQRRPLRRRLDLADHAPGILWDTPVRGLPEGTRHQPQHLDVATQPVGRGGPPQTRRVPAAAGALRVPADREGPRRLPDRRSDGGLWRQV